MEFAPSSAVPVSMIGHDPSVPVIVPRPFAVQSIVVAPVSVPDAVPATFRPPAQVALNEPLAVVAVCSVAVHLKSVHVDAAGIAPADAVAEVHLPIKEVTPVPVGPVVVVLCSKLVQPTTPTQAARAQARI